MDSIGRNASSSNIHSTHSASKLEKSLSAAQLSHITTALAGAQSELPNICDELDNVTTSAEQQLHEIQESIDEANAAQSDPPNYHPMARNLLTKYTQYDIKTNHPDLAGQIYLKEARVLKDIDRMNESEPGTKEFAQANFQFRKDALKLSQLQLKAITTSMHDLTELTQGLQAHLPKHN